MGVVARATVRSIGASALLAIWTAAGAWAETLEAGSAIRFRDVADDWGIHFRHHHGGSGELYMIETMGSGVVVFDPDGDGDRDVFFVDSGELPGYEGEATGSKLLRNDSGRFVDATAGSGLEVSSYGMGAVSGDVDGDGDVDLYVTGFGPNQLFRNDGAGRFVDVTASAGVGDDLLGASASLADVDLDGDLDLYVANYVDFGFDNNPICGEKERGIRSYCHPDVFNGLPDTFYRNRGDGTFVEETAAAGFGDAAGKGLGVVFSDLDSDGWPDLYVANDMTANFLFKNRGDGRFEEVAMLSGTALSDRGNPEASMGVDVGDLDGDGRPEIMATHMDEETNAVYGALGAWLFVDKRYSTRLAEPSVHLVGFGVVFADLDHDGDRDVAVANGHIIHNIEMWHEHITYEQPNQVFVNLGGGRFAEVADAGLVHVRPSRGMAAGDLDGDGDLDLVISNSNTVAEAYENVTGGAGGWLEVDLVGVGNTAGIGARLAVVAAGSTQEREVRTASSYMSQNQVTANFGVGDAATVDLLVTWPGGSRQRLRDVPTSRRLRVVHPTLAD